MPTVTHPPGRFVEVRGTRLWLEEEGDGPPLLLLSGGPASSHVVLHPAFSALRDRFRVLYLDYRGRGRSAPLADGAVPSFAGDVLDTAALVEALGYGPVHVYGFSYGGLVAQGLALDHPARVRRLVLANTLHSPEMWQRNHENINREIALQYPEVWDEILALRASGVGSTDPSVQALYQVHSRLVRFYDPDNAARLMSEPGAKNPELYRAFVGDDIEFAIGGQVPAMPDFRPRLREIRAPLLVLAGRYDRALYPAAQRDFQRSAPRARFVMLERSGSFSHVEEPERVVELVREHLTDDEAPPVGAGAATPAAGERE